jgi:hypothetical protein
LVRHGDGGGQISLRRDRAAAEFPDEPDKQTLKQGPIEANFVGGA